MWHLAWEAVSPQEAHMATTAGVGYSEVANSFEAGIEAATAAMTEAGVARCDLAIMSSTGKHDPRQLSDGVRSVIGPAARLIGGRSMGIITRDRLGYLGYQVGVAVMASDSVKVDMFIEKNLADREYEVGVALSPCSRRPTGSRPSSSPTSRTSSARRSR
jgi:hypothetical protein